MLETNNERQKSKRGFAAMSSERQREIASQGGRAAHLQGVAHQWNREEAKEAGRKGGRASGDRRKFQQDDSSTRP